jgi:probable HAF family extracellular repeat protein
VKKFAAALLAAALLAPVTAAGAVGGYTVESLGTLGGSYSLGLGIDNGGVAVGWSASASEVDRGFVFSHGVLSDVGTLPGGRFAHANAINERGQITGDSEISVASGFERHAFLYDRGRMTDLGTLGGPESVGTAIDDRGDVVGYSLPPGAAGGHDHAFL